VNVKDTDVQERANGEIREQFNDTVDEKVTKSCSNAGEKPNDIAVKTKTRKSTSDA
jgi:hypothetical protein